MFAKPRNFSLFYHSFKTYSNLSFKPDIVIIGGGVIGSSTAYFLAHNNPKLNIILFEKDFTYNYCATTRSAASIRHQFSIKENIQISQFGTEFIHNIDKYLKISGDECCINPQFKENGYLFLSSNNTSSILSNNVKLQQSCNANISLLYNQELKEKFPWMNVNDIHSGGFGNSGEGWFDPAILMNSFRKKAQSLGVKVIQGNVINIKIQNNNVNSIIYKDNNHNEIEVSCGFCINASGASNARNISLMIGRDIPVYPKKRCIFVFDCIDHNINNCPLVVDPSGMYFRPEGKTFITGIAPPENNDPNVSHDDFEVDYDLFEETIWPLLAERVPKFEAIKVINAWAGHYDYNTFDHNVIVGPDPLIKNFYYANGFSGHGLQQAPAIGRALSELIIHNKFITLDLSKFNVDRIENNKPIIELNVV